MRALRHLLWSFGRDLQGGVAIIGAAAVVLFVVLAALAIDLGSMTLKAREIQGAADLAALSAARNLPAANAAANATAQANLGADIIITTQTGVYLAERKIKPQNRFTVGGSVPNAARVTITGKAPLFFAGIFGAKTAPITRTATAALPGAKPTAVFSIGSRLLGLNRGLVNGLLGTLLGSNVNLSVMDYNRLLGADVNLLQFADALAVDLGVEAGDYDQLLKHDVTTGQLLRVLTALADDGERAVLGQLTGSRLDVPIKVGQLVGVDANARDGLRRALNMDVAALDLIVASLETANSNRQLALNGDVNAILADIRIMAAIGERPNDSSWLTVSAGGTPVIRTSQTRVFVRAKTKNLVDELVSVDLQVFAEVASAEAKIKDIQCAPSKRVDVDARTGLLRVSVGNVTNPGDLQNFKKRINTEELVLAEVLLLPLKIYANVESHDTKWQSLRFSEAQISAKTPQSVRSKEIGSSLLATLGKEMKITFLGLPLGWIVNLLTPLLVPIGYLLDAVLNPLLQLLGIGLGEADVRVLGINCPGGVGGIPYLVG